MQHERRSQLTIRTIKPDTAGENVVILSRDCSALRPDRLARFLKWRPASTTQALWPNVLIADGLESLGAGEIGLPRPALQPCSGLAQNPGDRAHVSIARPAASLDAVRAKIRGEELIRPGIRAVAEDLAGHRHTDIEMAAFLIATWRVAFL